ncbi:IS200/IS605 family accessory protein TnpB-related protein [Streptomyces sp. MI02-2A]|uniref:IS200/IS605 family accessory protein TnpB-related protein n=1 Tax=unclassified Streptomyces TaxID=2593676 RepID=UPI000741144D|nr:MULTISPECIES: IS200/IS605 family accessory protein TnpB-related protein [unclassified Streptomyces]KUJ35007.1 transposase [Streptomyces sp. NRRL F-5122]MDX3263775.1 IS200/IS605 family accessory protein TnpB-related protein [Streptomyces sp. MI02-2A]
MAEQRKPLREIGRPFVADGPSGVSIRDRLGGLMVQDEKVLRAVGEHMGRLASRDLARRCRDGLQHSTATWAERKRELTAQSSSRWAGSITARTHDQWGLSRRAQVAHLQSLDAGIRMLRHRLSLPVGQKGSRGTPGGYRSRHEWFHKSRRLAVLESEYERVRCEHRVGKLSVARGGRRLLKQRHHLAAAHKTQARWRQEWEAARWFLTADGESGKRFGNETIRVTPGGEISIKLPASLAHLANARHGRYILTAKVSFPHRGDEWRDRIVDNRAVAYRIHLDVTKGRWYLDASWTRKNLPVIPLAALRSDGVIGVDMNADHLAAWQLDEHGNPVGKPRRFDYDLTGTATRRDAQIRHALTRLLHWAKATGVQAIAIEDLDFTDSKTREKHGRKKRFRQLISGIPTGKLRARLLSMCAEAGIGVIAVDPAYTSRWGAEHWQAPLTTTTRKTTRHQAAAVAIGRRALGHPIRRRTAPPRRHQSDAGGHRTAQATSGARGREEHRPRVPGPRTRSVRAGHGRNAVDQNPQDRSGRSTEPGPWQHDPLPLSP